MKNRELLWAYIDGKLTDLEKQKIEYKLQSDPDFYEVYQSLKQVDNLLVTNLMWDAPSNLESAVIKKVRAQKYNTISEPFQTIKHIWIGIAACVVFIAFYLSFTNNWSGFGILDITEVSLNTEIMETVQTCKLYIYLSLICAALVVFTLSFEKGNQVSLSS